MSNLDYMLTKVGKTFSDNFSRTGSSLLLSIDGDKAFYMECYSVHANFTGYNVKGNVRTDEVRVPREGLKTMGLAQLERCIIGVI